eukprot:scaffold17.g532.t1
MRTVLFAPLMLALWCAQGADLKAVGLHVEQGSIADLIASLPKAELHVHVEGTLEPELMFELAMRNNVSLPFPDPAAARKAREHYVDLVDFLKHYEAGVAVLRTEADFFELADAYLARAAENNVRHAELFFDPQSHVERGVPFSVFMGGFGRAVDEAPGRHGVDAALILCFLRDRGAAKAALTLSEAKPYAQKLLGVGLDSAELGNPPELFEAVFAEAAALGLHRVAHAGEEGGPGYVWQAIEKLKVERVDHGIRSLEDPKLVALLAERRLPITLCPLSNLLLNVYAGSLEERLRQLLLDSPILVTINSDDPAYFGGYLNANYEFAHCVAQLSPAQLAALAAASFEASLMPEERKRAYVSEVRDALAAWEARGGGSSGGADGGAGDRSCHPGAKDA